MPKKIWGALIWFFALAVNGPARKLDLLRTVAGDYAGMTNVLNRLMDIGATVKSGSAKKQRFSLDERFVAHAELVSSCKALAVDYRVPEWAPTHHLCPLRRLTRLRRPSCQILGFERPARLLLFLYASGGARVVQISRFFDTTTGHHLSSALARPFNLGMIARLTEAEELSVGVVLDPRFRYHHVLIPLLKRLLSAEPSIESKARALEWPLNGGRLAA